MKHLTATELSHNLSATLDRVEHFGEEIIVERRGRPIARIVAPERRAPLKLSELAEFSRQNPLGPEAIEEVRSVIKRNKQFKMRDPWESS